jgi:phage head maturation protease
MPTATTAPELKFTALDLKAVEPDGTFAGYASLFGTEDLGSDIVLPGAFRDSLAKRGARGIKMLFQHKPEEPIGVWEQLKEDARGLYAKGRLMLDVARAREVLAGATCKARRTRRHRTAGPAGCRDCRRRTAARRAQ